jgi:Zn-dependent peptidase ImmA (M78 family)/DNA-binding XRE family transcriptional regulator
MADKAYITPKVLKWARESAKISEEAAASKIPVSIERLKEWEDGTSQPTIRQAQTLAKAYKRPFALLFLPEIPKDFQPLQDYRKAGAKNLSTSSIFIIREIQQKQSWIKEVNEENKEEKLSFVGKFSIADKAEIVANDILTTLKIDPLRYKTENPIREWIEKTEANGIFISRTSFIHSKLKLDSEEIQGFAIADPYAPFIFINSDDWNSAQLFTLVHELAHIWIAATGLSNEIEADLKSKDKYHPVELFCNDVAANALMPVSYMTTLDKVVFRNFKEIFKISKSLGVSSFSFLVRALNLNLIDVNLYQKLRKEADLEYKLFLKREEEKKAKQKEREGGPNPYLLRLNKNSRLFTQIVLDAFRSGSVEPTQASFLLNTPINKFSSLESQLYS